MPGKYSSDDSELSTEDLMKSIYGDKGPSDKKKKKEPKTIRDHSQSGIRGYFAKRNKIMKELDE